VRTETESTPRTDRVSRGRRFVARLVAVAAAITGLALTGATPAHAALACGVNELDQNVFLVNDGFWNNPVNWSRSHVPAGGEAVCVPGGIVARVNSSTTGLLGASGGSTTTLRVEGTVRIESGTTVGLATAIYGASNLINGGVIQVLGNSTFDMNADQAGAAAFQNAVGGSLIQVQSGSTILLRRGFVNAGTINLTGGGAFVLDSAASAYSTTNDGAIIGGKLRLRAGTVTYGNNGALAVLASGGSLRGTIGSAQSAEVACETFSGAVDISQGIVNNGSFTFSPPLAGDCEVSYTLPGGQTLTNNGTLTFGTPGMGSSSIRFSSFFYSSGGTIVNGPTGSLTVNGSWLSDDYITNNGTLTIATGARLEQRFYPMINNGTIVNRASCDLKTLQQTGTLELVNDCLVRQVATLSSTSTLRTTWTAAATAKLTVGSASTLAGTIDVVTVGGAPAAGTTRDLITGPVSGEASTVTSQSPSVGYTAYYPSGAVQLRAGAPGAGGINAIAPARLLDTRSNGTTVDGLGAGAGMQVAGATVQVQVTGRGNVPVDATAAVLNVTITGAQGSGYATVYPCGSTRPTASNLNFRAGVTVANGVIAKVGTGGKVCIYVDNATNLLADVSGFFTSASPYVPLTPARLLDTRANGTTIDGVAQAGGLVPAGGVVELLVGGRGSVPATAAGAALNVTIVGAQASGFATIFPCGSSQPTASNLNFNAGITVANNVMAKLGTGGKVCISVSKATQLIADVSGYFVASSGYRPITPARLLDSRSNGVTVDGVGQGGGPVTGGTVVEVQVTGRAGVPTTAVAAVLNITATQGAGTGYVTAYPCGTTPPTSSSLNFTIGATVPNGVIAKIGTNGRVCLFVSNGTQLIADLNGWFAG